jgi:hypothetical protein
MQTKRLAMWAAMVLASGCFEVEPLPIDEDHYGQSYAGWGASWWQWVFAHPATDHPLFDETGEHCGGGQQDPVWFLAGTFGGGPTHRTCVVPADQALLFPIVNLAIDNTGRPEEDWMTEAEASASLDSMLSTASGLYATFEGESLGDPAEFRVGMQQFSFALPASDSLFELWGLPGDDGVVDPAYSDGYYMLLEPLPPGEYELAFGGVIGFDPATTDDDIVVDMTYTLQVE